MTPKDILTTLAVKTARLGGNKIDSKLVDEALEELETELIKRLKEFMDKEQ